MKLFNSKLIIIGAFGVIAIVFTILFASIYKDLKQTNSQAKDEMTVLSTMNHLDKLNTSFTYLEKNEMLHVLLKNKSVIPDIQKGVIEGVIEMDSLKQNCDGRFFNCDDVTQLDSIFREKLKFSTAIVTISSGKHPDSALMLLRGNNRDSIMITSFINTYNRIYSQGEKLVIAFQEDHKKETASKSRTIFIIIIATILFLLISSWKLLQQESEKDKLITSNQVFADIINNSFDSISISDANHRLSYCNESVLKLYKINRSDIIGKPIDEVFISKETKEGIAEKIRSIDQKGYWMGEIERRDSANNPIFVHLSINVIKDKNGKIIGHAAIAADITDLKKYQLKIDQLAESLQATNIELEQKVNEQTALIKEVFERVKDVFIGTDEQLLIKYVNSNIQSLFGIKEKEIFGTGISQLLSKICGVQNANIALDSFADQQVRNFEFLYPASNSFFQVSIFPSAKGISLYFKDITAAKIAEEEIKKSNRLYEFISKTNDLILNAQKQDDIFAAICKIAIDTGGYRFSWIGIPDKDKRVIKPIIWAGHEAGYLSSIKMISLDDIPEGRGTTGKAMREGKFYYCNDIANDPAMEIWRKECLDRGYRSSISFPVKASGELVACFVIYASSPFYFTIEEIALLNKVAENVGFAISTFNAEIKRKETELQLKKVSQAIDHSSASVVITDLKGDIEYVNPVFTELTGYSSEEIIGQNQRILKTGFTNDEGYKNLWQKLMHKETWQGEFLNKKKNGDHYWEYAIISPILNEKGEVTNFVAVKENISERKRLENEQNELVKIIETTTAFVGRADLNRNILYLNKAMKDGLEIGEEEDIRKLNIMEFADSSITLLDDQFKQLDETGKWIGENIFRARSGKKIPVLQIIVLHKNELGEPVGTSTTAIDLTKIKEAERALLRSNSELKDFTNHLQNLSEIEKKEIAREIHDELGQNLTALILRISWLRNNLGDDKAALQTELDGLNENIKELVASFRKIHSSLHPAMLEDLGLEETLNWFFNSVKRSTNIKINFYSELNGKKIDFDTELPLYRIVQECFTNIMRYSKATKATVSLQQNDDMVTLTVNDDGVGFEVNKVDTKQHHGILGIRERVYAMGGEFEIQSAPGEGTNIIVKVPVT